MQTYVDALKKCLLRKRGEATFLFVKLLKDCMLNKNFRSVFGVVKWINKLKDIQIENGYDDNDYRIGTEVAIRQGEKPDYYQINDDINNLVNKISNDADSIIIVADDETKNYFFENNIDTSRIFSVEDSIGIEYDKVYCINLLKYTEENNDFNKLYIATTRSRYKLTFIEENETDLINKFENYYNDVNSNELEDKVAVEHDITKWLEEAEKLEYLEKYYYAAKAYEKAEKYDRQAYCEQMYEKQSALFNLQEKGIYIDIYIDDYIDSLSTKNLQMILDKLENTYGLKLDSWLEITAYHMVGGLPKNSYVYLKHNIDNKTTAENILKSLNYNIMSNNHITLKIVDTSSINTDLIINFNDDSIKIVKNEVTMLREVAKKKEMEKKRLINNFNVDFGVNVKKIQEREEINKKTTDEILNDILS